MGGLIVHGIHATSVALFLTAVIFAALYDVLTYRIPNWVPAVVVGSFAAAAVSADLSGKDAMIHVGAGLTMLVGGIVLFSARLIGGGDAKLMAAVALWMGFGPLLMFLLIVALLGGGLAVAVMAARRIRFPASWVAAPWLERLLSPKQGLPYGVAITAGTLLTVFRQSHSNPLFDIKLGF